MRKAAANSRAGAVALFLLTGWPPLLATRGARVAWAMNCDPDGIDLRGMHSTHSVQSLSLRLLSKLFDQPAPVGIQQRRRHLPTMLLRLHLPLLAPDLSFVSGDLFLNRVVHP